MGAPGCKCPEPNPAEVCAQAEDSEARLRAEPEAIKKELRASHIREDSLVEEIRMVRERLKEEVEGQFSVRFVAGKAASLAGAVAEHVLDSTDVDDQLSKHIGTAKDVCMDAADKIGSMNY